MPNQYRSSLGTVDDGQSPPDEQLQATAGALGNLFDVSVAMGVLAESAGNDVGLAQARTMAQVARDFAVKFQVTIPTSWADALPQDAVPPGLSGVGLDLLVKAKNLIVEKSAALADKLGLVAVEDEAASIVVKTAATEGEDLAAKLAAEKGLQWSGGKVFAVVVGTVTIGGVVAWLGPQWTEQFLQARNAAETFGVALKACADAGTPPDKCDALWAKAKEAQDLSAASIHQAGFLGAIFNPKVLVIVGLIVLVIWWLSPRRTAVYTTNPRRRLAA